MVTMCESILEANYVQWRFTMRCHNVTMFSMFTIFTNFYLTMFPMRCHLWASLFVSTQAEQLRHHRVCPTSILNSYLDFISRREFYLKFRLAYERAQGVQLANWQIWNERYMELHLKYLKLNLCVNLDLELNLYFFLAFNFDLVLDSI